MTRKEIEARVMRHAAQQVGDALGALVQLETLLDGVEESPLSFSINSVLHWQFDQQLVQLLEKASGDFAEWDDEERREFFGEVGMVARKVASAGLVLSFVAQISQEVLGNEAKAS